MASAVAGDRNPVRSYWFKTVLGLALFLAGLAAFEYALYELMQIGTCASGGPYVSARPCPAGTLGKALLLPAGFMVGTIGIIVFALRGRRLGAPEDGRRLNATVLAWSGLFIVTGVVALLASIGPGADPGPGAEWVGIFLCALFVPMGIAPLLFAVFNKPVQIDNLGPPVRPRPVARPRPRPTGDPVDRLRKLGDLREAGVLSAAEFDAAKARILAEL
jgi:hypothetical protein